jgi:DNA-binding transcriptional LysR family regulator
MHLETLRTFCDVIETGSLSQAARLNRVTQSAVSQQLRALEQRYGRRLVERAPRLGARGTEAGQLLYGELKPLLERFADVEQRLRHGTDAAAIAGSVRVATVYSVGLHTLPSAMKKFLRAHPQVTLRLEYRRTDQVYEACVSGSADIGIVALPSRRSGLEIVPLASDELVVVLPPGHALARRRGLSLADLDGQSFIAFDRDIPTRKLVDRLLRQQGAAVRIAMELDNIETIKRSVEAGLGISILPAPALHNEVRARTLVMRRVREGRLQRAIGALHPRRRELSPAARALLAVVRGDAT